MRKWRVMLRLARGAMRTAMAGRWVPTSGTCRSLRPRKESNPEVEEGEGSFETGADTVATGGGGTLNVSANRGGRPLLPCGEIFGGGDTLSALVAAARPALRSRMAFSTSESWRDALLGSAAGPPPVAWGAAWARTSSAMPTASSVAASLSAAAARAAAPPPYRMAAGSFPIGTTRREFALVLARNGAASVGRANDVATPGASRAWLRGEAGFEGWTDAGAENELA
eukprot:scaffold13893_cov27-Tisochrysis_lutea.AAC.3